MTNEIIFASLIGSILPDAIRIIKTKDQPAPKYFASLYFWIGLLLQIGVGIAASWLTGPESAKQAVLISYAAPSIITSLVAQFEKTQTGEKGIDKSFKAGLDKLRTFWRN